MIKFLFKYVSVLFIIANLDCFCQVVSLDNIGTAASNGGATSLAWTHSITTNTNRILFVFATTAINSGTAAPATNAKINSTNLTLLTSAIFIPSIKSYLFYMLNPPSGTSTISLNVSSADFVSVGSVSFYNVNQTVPTFSTFSGTSSSASFSINTLYANNLLAGFFGVRKNINSVGTGQTEVFFSGTSGRSYSELSTKTSTSTLTSFSVGIAGSADWESIFVPIIPLNATYLPIELIDFNAKIINNRVVLCWQTVTEKNNAYFTIEKSIDGLNFIKIKDIPTKAVGGNSQTILKYEVYDDFESENIYYYRLKQTDIDGKSEIFEVITPFFCEEKNMSIKFIYNSEKDEFKLVSNYKFKTNTIIQVSDASGKIVFDTKLAEPDKEIKINLSKNIGYGLYYFTLRNNTGVIYNHKFVRN